MTTNHKMDWSIESLGMLAKMWRAGASAEKIAAAIGRTPGAVYQAACNSGLPRRVPQGKYFNKNEVVRGADAYEDAMRAESAKALAEYTELVYEAGGGSWGGVLSNVDFQNSVGGTR